MRLLHIGLGSGRRGWDSNPRIFRLVVFKTTALNRSATPPGPLAIIATGGRRSRGTALPSSVRTLLRGRAPPYGHQPRQSVHHGVDRFRAFPAGVDSDFGPTGPNRPMSESTNTVAVGIPIAAARCEGAESLPI